MSGLLEQRADRNQARGRDDNRHRSYQETKPKDTYYRDEYGWIMSDADVAKEQGVKKQYDRNVKSIEKQINQKTKQYHDSVAKGRGQINSAYDGAIGGIKKPSGGGLDLVHVRVMNGQTHEATYEVPRAYANEYANSQGLSTKWFDNNLNVDVKAGGRTIGQELHDALRDASNQTAAAKKKASSQANTAYNTVVNNTNTQRQKELDNFNQTSAKNFAGAQKVWAKELKSARAAYGKRVAQGRESYQKFVKDRSNSVLGVDDGLLQSRTNNVERGNNAS